MLASSVPGICTLQGKEGIASEAEAKELQKLKEQLIAAEKSLKDETSAKQVCADFSLIYGCFTLALALGTMRPVA